MGGSYYSHDDYAARRGFHPHTTWTDCTHGNATRLWEQYGEGKLETVGVFRNYFTRHGAGPFPTEDPSDVYQEAHNGFHSSMGKFRTGRFDHVLAGYAFERCPVDSFAITHRDQDPGPVCVDYRDWDGKFTAESLSRVTPVLDIGDPIRLLSQMAPVSTISVGPMPCNKIAMVECAA